MNHPPGYIRKRRIIHGHDLVGWDKIAGALDVSISKAKKLAKREHDPLPVKRLFGRVRASSDTLKAWCESQDEAA